MNLAILLSSSIWEFVAELFISLCLFNVQFLLRSLTWFNDLSFLLLSSSNWSTSWYGSKVCVFGSGPAENPLPVLSSILGQREAS